MIIRDYDSARDRAAALRIWREVGWLDDKEEEEMAALYMEAGRALVAEVHGEAECLVLTTMGDMRYLDATLPFSCVSGVTTSHVARRQGLALRVAARAIAADALQGAAVCGLGMFEQGYYNRIGFGTGGYENWLRFDPAHLNVPARPRIPRRITSDDWEAAHAARLARRRGHGNCNLFSPMMTRGEMHGGTLFGLGYRDEHTGELTHYIWCSSNDMENGPYTVQWMVYRTYDELMELLGLIHTLSEQVMLVKVREPAGIQLQDLLRQPFKGRRVTGKSKYEASMHAFAYWQMRMCDVRACLAATHLRCEPLRFNLQLADPIADFLPDESTWTGVGGDYIVTLGAQSHAESGQRDGLPTLTASVGAFTRLWLGAVPATGLAITDDVAAPDELLEALDWALRLPRPSPDWDF